MSASSPSAGGGSVGAVDLSAIDAEIAEFEAEVGDLSALDTSEFSLADVDALLHEYEQAAAAVQIHGHGAVEQDTAMVS